MDEERDKREKEDASGKLILGSESHVAFTSGLITFGFCFGSDKDKNRSRDVLPFDRKAVMIRVNRCCLSVRSLPRVGYYVAYKVTHTMYKYLIKTCTEIGIF